MVELAAQVRIHVYIIFKNLRIANKHNFFFLLFDAGLRFISAPFLRDLLFHARSGRIFRLEMELMLDEQKAGQHSDG